MTNLIAGHQTAIDRKRERQRAMAWDLASVIQTQYVLDFLDAGDKI